MKPLSIEEKAKRYDDLIRSIGRLMAQGVDPLITRGDVQDFFPELKESDDERIRKEIIEMLINWASVHYITKEQFSERMAWLEKQSEPKILGIGIENASGALKECIDKIEQKSTDKVEPKFHEGEWITNGEDTWKIVKVKPLDYILQSQNGNIVDDTISFVDEYFHSFTIEDAKDGDVLNSPSGRLIWIYKDNEHYHACVNMNYVTENTATNGLISIPNDACPATNDERIILFSNIEKSGCEWDVKKKELKKIEQNSIEPDDLIEESYQQQADDLIDMVTEKSKWSE